MNKVQMLAFWVIQDVSTLKYFYEATLQGAIDAQLKHKHPHDLEGISTEEISEATDLIRTGLGNLGWKLIGQPTTGPCVL